MNLKELSALLGISQTTISRALNDFPEVSEATRKRVKAAAITHNYRANPRAKGLATGRSMAIGHVIPISTKHEIVNPIFADFIAAAGEVYSRNAHDMLMSVVADVDEERTYRDLAAKTSVDGVIVHGPKPNDSRIKLLKSLGLPFVVHGRASDGDTDYSWVDVNNRRSFERAANFLLDLGHQRIALINGLEFMDFAKRRKDGFLDALNNRGVIARPEWMVSDEMTEDFGYRSAIFMLGQPVAPTAFIVSSMIMAIGVRRAIGEAGLKMGSDISVIIHDDALSYLPNGAEIPMFTATKSSVHHAGQLCAQMLLDIIADKDPIPRHILLETELTVGESTGPVPK
ncbi:MAG: substrate-binding domain-containing protein [Rhodobacteraceae bacterium]|nr:substrate-binding domain-containing protein [Paracoccaceae bacterium]